MGLNRAGFLDNSWVQRGHLLDHPKTLWKTNFFFWFSESLCWIRKAKNLQKDLQHHSFMPPPALLGLRVIWKNIVKNSQTVRDGFKKLKWIFPLFRGSATISRSAQNGLVSEKNNLIFPFLDQTQKWKFYFFIFLTLPL